jgi:pimeloyl-ACP methyl ester carboxylesterase
MAFFCNEKYSLHYLMPGQGEALVLIHGLGCSGADWAFQVAELEKRFRVIIPDLPGSGHSPAPRGEYSMGGFATALWL